MKRSLLSLMAVLSAIFVFAQASNPFVEVSPNVDNPASATKGAWVVQFQHSTPLSASAGCETDGTNYYVTQWNSNKIWKLDMSGNVVDSFTISGVTGLRDLAYDGTYFYGGKAGGQIFEMNFSATPPALVSTINCPSGVQVRNISYDPTADGGNGGFWVGNWGTDLTLVSRTGSSLGTIASSTHMQSSMYGSAFDTITPGGPYIWVATAGAAPNGIHQIHVATGAPTGLSHYFKDDIDPSDSYLGGGLWIEPGIVTGTVTLGGLLQGHSLYGYDLASVIPDTLDLAMSVLGVPAMVPIGQNVNVTGTITNEGLATITSFDLHYQIGNDPVVTQNVTGVSIASFSTHNFTHSTPWVPAAGTHDVKVWTSNPNGGTDASPSNDTMMTTCIAYDPAAAVQRLPLHEGFTSSTCGPCVAGNANVKSVLNANPNKWVLLKYQMSWPGAGDPYYTAEGGDRRMYYGVSSVPNLKVEGGHAYDGNSSSYTATELNNAYAIPSFVDLSATMIINDAAQEVYVQVYMNPGITVPAGTKLHVAIFSHWELA